jgi:ATP-dependent Clp protease ATP-binding subunit ClpX
MPSSTDASADSHCGFCGRDKKESGLLISGETVKGHTTYICAECAKICVDTLIQEKQADGSQSMSITIQDIPLPKEIYKHLSRSIIGQEAAKQKLSVGVVNHYKRLVDNESPETIDDEELKDVSIEKSNILLVGKTGTGKTLFARCLADKLGVPFAIADATTLTEAGYVGEDVENILLNLLRSADGDVAAAERGIIYIDEIDKMYSNRC